MDAFADLHELGLEPLHQVTSGRLFVRRASASAPFGARDVGRIAPKPAVVVGVVELPGTVELERVHVARLNSSLWLDLQRSRRPMNQLGDRADMREDDLGGVLMSSGWRAGALPDAFEVFVRGTFLEPSSTGLRWVYVAGMLAHCPADFAKDGIYELGANGIELVQENTFTGMSVHQPLRVPLWGPGGRFGLATSMDPLVYPKWIQQDRERSMSKDPAFAAFVERMDAEMPLKMAYTAEENAAREALAKRVLREVMAAEGAAAARPRPR